MDRRQFVLGGVAAVAAAGALPAQANGRKNPDCDHEDPPDCPDHPECPHKPHIGLVGSWFGRKELQEGAFADLISFTPGGVVMVSSRPLVGQTAIGAMYATAGHGAWKALDDTEVKVFYRVLLQSMETGEQCGTEDVTLSLTIGHQPRKLTGLFESRIMDVAGNTLGTSSGVYLATRIKV